MARDRLWLHLLLHCLQLRSLELLQQQGHQFNLLHKSLPEWIYLFCVVALLSVVPSWLVVQVSVLRCLSPELSREVSLILVPLSALPEDQVRAAVREVLCWQVNGEPLQRHGAAAAAVARVGKLLTWAERVVTDAAEEARGQLRAAIKMARPRSESPRPQGPKRCRSELPWPCQLERRRAPPPPPAPHHGSRWDAGPMGSRGDVKGLKEQDVENALRCLWEAGVDDPRVLFEFRQLHERDSPAACGVLEKLCEQAAAGIEKPNNYARSLTSAARLQAGLWT